MTQILLKIALELGLQFDGENITQFKQIEELEFYNSETQQ
jgi:hypothetical protein